jgi:hypothetical protein
MKPLRRYWFNFETFARPTPLNLGCGVTAYDYADATNLLREGMFSGKELPLIVGCVEDVDVSTLDPKHILPNLGLVDVRGIWFPQGYKAVIGSTLGEIRQSYNVDWIAFGEGPLFARVDQIGMSFALDYKNPPAEWRKTNDQKLIPDSARVVFIFLASRKRTVVEP